MFKAGRPHLLMVKARRPHVLTARAGRPNMITCLRLVGQVFNISGPVGHACYLAYDELAKWAIRMFI